MTKSVKVTEIENGSKYFIIYEVKAEKHDGTIIVVDRFVSRKKAEEYKEFCDVAYTSLYKIVYIMEQMVWC